MTEPPASEPMPRETRVEGTLARLGRILAILVIFWGMVAYVLAPRVWSTYFRRHGALADGQRITRTSDGHPGDPVNLALLGTEEELVRAMEAAGWYPADPVTVRTSLRIAVSSVLGRPDEEAPVSALFLFGRKQDLAFELPVGDNPRKRHHVRYWKWDRPDEGRAVWFGAATFDERVGLSYTTGQITHHIDSDVDAERDRIARELEKAGWVLEFSWLKDFHSVRAGRNGGGDAWRTDGALAVIELRAPGAGRPDGAP